MFSYSAKVAKQRSGRYLKAVRCSIAEEHVWDPCEPVLKKSRNAQSIECDKVSNKDSGVELCCEEPVPYALESDGVSMEAHSESGEENNSTPEYYEEYTAEEIEANYGRQVLTESMKMCPVHLLTEKKKTQKMTRLNINSMKKVCFFTYQ